MFYAAQPEHEPHSLTSWHHTETVTGQMVKLNVTDIITDQEIETSKRNIPNGCSLKLLNIDSTSQELCTWCVLLWCGSGRFYPYPSGLLHWHCPSASEATLKDMEIWIFKDFKHFIQHRIQNWRSLQLKQPLCLTEVNQSSAYCSLVCKITHILTLFYLGQDSDDINKWFHEFQEKLISFLYVCYQLILVLV